MATYSSNFAAILALAGTGGGDLAATLALGNTTGGTDIEFSFSGTPGFLDRITSEDNVGGPGYEFNLEGSSAIGGAFPGGDINLTPGFGTGGQPDGVVNINGDLNVTGTTFLTNLKSGTGSPVGSETGAVGTLYSRTDGAGGNSLYVKMLAAGTTGWCPMGPRVIETFTSVGAASFVTAGPGFSDPDGLGVNRLSVYWNGVLQREGGADDYTTAYNVADITVTFNSTPPASDLVTIEYLPE